MEPDYMDEKNRFCTVSYIQSAVLRAYRINCSVGNVEVAEIENEVEPFVGHALCRVRVWAVWEIQQAKREREWFEESE
jgi:hypothetical protein